MAFIRVKKVKDNVYCYIVENKWSKSKNKPKQKVKKYLGRVYMYDDDKRDFYEIIGVSDKESYLKEKSRSEILRDLVEAELLRKGFSKKDSVLTQGDVSFPLEKLSFLVKGKEKNIAVASNHGFLHKWTINRIFEFKKGGDTKKNGFRLAKFFVEAGINVPREVFVAVFEKS